MPTIPIALAVASIAASGAQAYQSSKNASEQKHEQKKQLALQRKTALIQARREARIKAAQFAASTSGAGVSGSIISGTEIGMKSSLEGGFQTAESQYSLQSKQFDIAADTTKQNAFFDFGQSVVGAGSMAYKMDANVFLKEDE
jgi:hypothetical protein